jgi:hypothetical protein
MSERFVLKELCRYNIGTFGDLVCRNAILHQDKDAFIWGTDRITFGQFNGRVTPASWITTTSTTRTLTNTKRRVSSPVREALWMSENKKLIERYGSVGFVAGKFSTGEMAE